MLITSGREAFWNAISEAKQQAKISQVEREKALSFQTMLDNAYEGLVVIDRNQQISFLNTAAIQILQLSRREQYLGKPASSVFSTPGVEPHRVRDGEHGRDYRLQKHPPVRQNEKHDDARPPGWNCGFPAERRADPDHGGPAAQKAPLQGTQGQVHLRGTSSPAARG